MRIVLDAGHGGTNTGCDHNGILEKIFTLDMASRLARLATDCGIGTTMTRVVDIDVGLSERGAIAKKAQPDLVVSIHADASENPGDGFLSCYVLPGDGVGAAVAAEIERTAPDVLRSRDPAVVYVKPTDWTDRAFNVLSPHKGTPAVLVECGFLSNPKHATFLKTQHGRFAVANAIMAGIATAWEMTHGAE